jgi:prepilin-type processing-associated H-X9-DG protein
MTDDNSKKKKESLLVKVLLVVGIVALLASIFVDLPPMLIALGVLAGWIMFIMRLPAQIQLNFAAIATGVICLLGTLVVGHVLARWFWRETRHRESEPSGSAAGPKPWRLRWTICLVGLFVAMFVCGIGATGAIHQAAWLARSPQPLFHYPTRETANRVKCASNLRQIGQAMQLYAQAHGDKLPDSIADLLLDDDTPAAIFACPTSNAEPPDGATAAERIARFDEQHNSYVYHGRGLTLPLPSDLPIACEPLLNHDGDGVNVLYGDLHVEWTAPSEIEKVMRAVR